jgi:hypothetical protein
VCAGRPIVKPSEWLLTVIMGAILLLCLYEAALAVLVWGGVV